MLVALLPLLAAVVSAAPDRKHDIFSRYGSNRTIADLPRGNPIIPTPGHYNTSGGPKEGVINVHIVSHTHVSTY